MTTLYETDFSAWLEDQIQMMKKKDFEHLDLENLLEEMEDLGSSNRDAIESHLVNILLHLLKIKYQPSHETRSWHDSIFASQAEIAKKIKRNPSLQNYPRKCLESCLFQARKLASKQTGFVMEKFSKECTWSIEEILGE